MSRSMQQIADEIRAHGHNLIRIADAMAEKADPPPEEKIRFTDLRSRLAERSREGFTDAIRNILTAHGAEKLSALDESEYAGVLAEVEALS